MAFIVPSGQFTNHDPADVDSYPQDTGTKSGSQTDKPVSKIGGGSKFSRMMDDPRVQAAAAAAGQSLIDYVNNKFKDRQDGNRNRRNSNDRSKRRSGRESDNSDNSYASGGGGSPHSRGFQERSGTDFVSYRSGISAGLTVNSRLTSDQSSSLYLSSGGFFTVYDDDLKDNPKIQNEVITALERIFYPLTEDVITNRINRWAGQYINFRDYKDYIFKLVDALQLYYCIDSVLTYSTHNTVDNVNIGMEALKQSLNSETIYEYTLLRDKLNNMTAPPRLVEFIRYMYQNFRLSSAPHAPIVKLNYGGLFDTYWEDKTAHIQAQLLNANSALNSVSKFNSFMSRAFPGWLIGSLPPSAKLAVYDLNFHTFWHNQNCCYLPSNSATKFVYTHVNLGLDDYLDYQIIERDSDVDGAIFACASTFVKKDKSDDTLISHWGLWQPAAIITGKDFPKGNCRESFNIKFINNKGFTESVKDTVMLGDTGIHWVAVFTGNIGNYLGRSMEFGSYGFVKLQVVSARMQSEAFNNTMRLWFTPVDNYQSSRYGR
jgi:hypothetical protein